jgi:hypothetical protein
VILYHTSGEAFALSPGLWRRALERARAFGWRPVAPLPPPVSLDGTPSMWDGGYESPTGQQVSRPDAMALGLALERSLAGRPEPASALQDLARFCPSPGITDSLASLADHLGVGAAAAPLRGQAQPVKPPQKGTKSAAL